MKGEGGDTLCGRTDCRGGDRTFLGEGTAGAINCCGDAVGKPPGGGIVEGAKGL